MPVIAEPSPYRELAAAYALEGKMDDAKTALAEALRVKVPNSPSNRLRAQNTSYPVPAGRPAQGGAARGVSETRKIAAILVGRRRRLQPHGGRGRGSHAGAAAGAARRPHRSIDRRARRARGPCCADPRTPALAHRPAFPPEATFAAIHDSCSASGRSPTHCRRLSLQARERREST